MTEGTVDPAEARKRRKAIITQRQEELSDNNGKPIAAGADGIIPEGELVTQSDSLPEDADEGTAGDKEDLEISPMESSTGANVNNNKKRKKSDASAAEKTAGNKKKTQIRYDPDVPMSKEQLAAWRREARRVRNRESAAASRQRIRSRITELETEVEGWKAKYQQAMERLEHLQSVAAVAAAAAAISESPADQTQDAVDSAIASTDDV